jgi:hypothetical protein
MRVRMKHTQVTFQPHSMRHLILLHLQALDGSGIGGEIARTGLANYPGRQACKKPNLEGTTREARLWFRITQGGVVHEVMRAFARSPSRLSLAQCVMDATRLVSPPFGLYRLSRSASPCLEVCRKWIR